MWVWGCGFGDAAWEMRFGDAVIHQRTRGRIPGQGPEGRRSGAHSPIDSIKKTAFSKWLAPPALPAAARRTAGAMNPCPFHTSPSILAPSPASTSAAPP